MKMRLRRTTPDDPARGHVRTAPIGALVVLFCVSMHAQSQQYGGGFSYGEVRTGQTTFDPIHRSERLADRAGHMLFSALIAFDNTGKPLPQLIDMTVDDLRSYAPLNDITYDFPVRQDVRWHDGEPFTAYDVLFTYLAMLNSTTVRDQVEFIATVRVDDPTHVRIVLKNPILGALGRMTFPIIPHHPFVGNPRDVRADNPACEVPWGDEYLPQPAGTGPFSLAAPMYPNERRFEVIDPYPLLTPPRTRAYPDWIRLRTYPDLETLAKDFGFGGINLAVALPRSLVTEVQASSASPRSEERYPATSYYYLAFNHRHQFLGDERNGRDVRQAINHGTNRRQWMELVEGGSGGGIAISGPFPDDSPYNNPRVDVYPYNPDTARALLAQAGFSDTNDDGTLDKDGKPFKLTVVPRDTMRQSQICRSFQTDMRALDIEVEIEPALSTEAWTQRVWHGQDFDVALGGWSFGLGGDLYALFHSTQSYPGGKNFGRYQNFFVDSMLEQAREETDPTTFRGIMQMLHEELHKEAPYVFLWTPIRTAVWDSRIHDVDVHPSGFFNYVTDWWVGTAEN
jgi:peptide/nickel transport system substrate-binding protein